MGKLEDLKDTYSDIMHKTASHAQINMNDLAWLLSTLTQGHNLVKDVLANGFDERKIELAKRFVEKTS